jgi:hypothetical protein
MIPSAHFAVALSYNPVIPKIHGHVVTGLGLSLPENFLYILIIWARILHNILLVQYSLRQNRQSVEFDILSSGHAQGSPGPALLVTAPHVTGHADPAVKHISRKTTCLRL